jgi:hypothetical protein
LGCVLPCSPPSPLPFTRLTYGSRPLGGIPVQYVNALPLPSCPTDEGRCWIGTPPFCSVLPTLTLPTLLPLSPPPPPHTPLCQVIDAAELTRRMVAATAAGDHHFYIMELAPGLYIDARWKGNLARLLNSSCQPNCETQKWYDAATGEVRSWGWGGGVFVGVEGGELGRRRCSGTMLGPLFGVIIRTPFCLLAPSHPQDVSTCIR